MTDTLVTLDERQRTGLRNAVSLMATGFDIGSDVSSEEMRAHGTCAHVCADLLELAEGLRERLGDRERESAIPFLRTQCAETHSYITEERDQLGKLEGAADPSRLVFPGETREESIATYHRLIAAAQREVDTCEALLAQIQAA